MLQLVGRSLDGRLLGPQLTADDEVSRAEGVENLIELVKAELLAFRPPALLRLDDPAVEVDQLRRWMLFFIATI